MPPVIGAIAGVLEAYGVTTAIATSIATTLVLTAAEFAISAVAEALAPKKKTGTGSALESNYYDPEAGLIVIFGSVRIGGMEVIPPTTSQPDGAYLHKIIAIAGHQVASFGEAYANDKIIHLPLIGAVTGGTNDGVVTEPAFEVKGNPHLWLRRYDGSQTSVDWKLHNEVDSVGFPSTFVGKGIAYAAMQLWWDQTLWTAGVPSFMNIVQGALCYDPRQDSTNGGSGTQRYATPSTWAWSENPAVCLSTYLISSYGGDYDPTEIDWTTVAAAANTCDGIVPVLSSFTTLTTIGTATHTGTTAVAKPTGVNVWDSAVHSTDSYTTGIEVSASITVSGCNLMLGFTTLASPSGGYGDAAFAIQMTDSGSPWIYENAVNVQQVSTVGIGDVCRVTYDGSYVRYFINSTLIRTSKVATPNTALYMYVPIFSVGTAASINIQKRYTCNGALKATDDFTANVKGLLSSMTGRALYTNGKWKLYAGSWQTPTLTINESDWVGPHGLKFQFDGGRDYRFNRGRSWYIDPNKNWQRTEAYPRVNNTYYLDDGNEWIDMQTDFPFCLTSYEAQRQAEFLLRQSRNQVRVTGKLPPRWQQLNLWDTVYVNHALIGWNTKSFRVSQCTINPDSSVDVVLSEENAADWNDLQASEYNALDPTPLQPISPAPPGVAFSFKTVGGPGTIEFDWVPPAGAPLNTTYQVWSSNSPVVNPDSANLLYNGPDLSLSLRTPYLIPTYNPGPTYYGITASVGSLQGTLYPTSAGRQAFAFVTANNPIANPVLLDPEFVGKYPSSYAFAPFSNTYLAAVGNYGGAIAVNSNTGGGGPNSYFLMMSAMSRGNFTCAAVVEMQYKVASAFKTGQTLVPTVVAAIDPGSFGVSALVTALTTIAVDTITEGWMQYIGVTNFFSCGTPNVGASSYNLPMVAVGFGAIGSDSGLLYLDRVNLVLMPTFASSRAWHARIL